MKHRRWAALLVVVGVCLAIQSPATAATTPGSAVCLGSWRMSFSPGLTLNLGTVQYRTEDAAIHCTGTTGGSPITGAGKLAQEGSITGTALGGRGAGTTTLELPTAAGLKSVTFSDAFVYGPGIGVKGSSSLLGPWIFTFVPSAGDGIFKPVTEIAVAGGFTLQS